MQSALNNQQHRAGVSVYEPKGRTFESCRAHHRNQSFRKIPRNETCTWRIAKLPPKRPFAQVDRIAAMRDFLILFVHVIVTVARLAGPGGLRSVVAESVLVRHQLLILNRGRKRASKLRTADRITAGLCTLFIRPTRILRSAIVLKPSTLRKRLVNHRGRRLAARGWQGAFRLEGRLRGSSSCAEATPQSG